MSISHGTRAVPSEGTRFRVTSNQLNSENYSVWSGRLKGVLMVNNVWDIVSEDRLKPARPQALIFGDEAATSEAIVSSKNAADKYDAYIADFRKAACLLVEAISDSQLSGMQNIMDDPIVLWKKLQQKFARKSEMGKSSAQKALLSFAHMETESADETISRFEALVLKCEQQEVQIYEHGLERALLDQPNDRYKALKRSWQHARDKQDLQELFASMRDDDDEYQRDAAPPVGSAAMAEAFKIELQQEIQKAEILWAQKYGKDKARSGSSRPAASYTLCYCCGDKGHYARDCPQAGSARCNFCKRNGHLEKACRQKKDKEGTGGGGSGEGGEASFFHGASSCAMLELTHCDYHHSVKMLQQDSSTATIGEALATGLLSTPATTFLADSGASHHICHDRKYFCKLEPLSGPFKVNQVQGSIDVFFSGSVMLEVDTTVGKQNFRLDNVLLIETMSFNIISLQKLRAANMFYVFNELPGKVVLKKGLPNGKLAQVALFSETPSGRMTLDCRILTPPPIMPSCRQAEVFSNSLSMDLFHRRLGHSGQAALQRILRENMATGIGQVAGSVSPCDSCQLGKLTRPPHPSVQFDHHTTRPLQLVVMDLAGPVRPRSLGGASYFLGLLDVFTRFSWAFPIKKKSDAANKILEWKPVAENQCKEKLLNLRSDNGGEFTSKAFKYKMAILGVTLQTTPPRSPESNGMQERWNRTVQDKARTIMIAAALLGYLWAEVLQGTNMLRNMTAVTNLSCTPFEKWTGKKPDLSKLRVIGCKAFCQIPKSAREGKFGAVSWNGVLISYGMHSPVYRIWKTDTHKVYDVAAPAFDEDAEPGWWRESAADEEEDEPLVFPPFPDFPVAPSSTLTEVIDTSASTSPADSESAPDICDSVPASEAPPALAQQPATMPPAVPAPAHPAGPAPRRSTRANRGVPPAYMADMIMIATMESPASEPQTYKQAMKLPDSAQWLAACKAEVASLVDNKVFKCVERPASHPVITSKWVFKKKRNLAGEVEKYKARLVARGYMQAEGIDYTETYSPTLRFESIRLMLAVAASEGQHMEQMDVTTAFLYTDLQEEVYLEIPEGMFDEDMGGKVLRLYKALYGLKQSPRMWNQHVDKALSEFGLKRLTADFCVYVIHQGNERILLGLFVDDMFIIGRIMDLINMLKSFLKGRFKMQDLGAATFLLGMEIRRLPGGDVKLLQEKYLGEVLERFPVENLRATSTPLPPGCKLSLKDSPQSEAEARQMATIPYRSAVGSLMYLAVCTRPDISAAISSLSRFNSKPGMAHWEGVQHVLRYLKGTSGEGIIYKKGVSTALWGYCDSSHLTCPDNSRSRSAFVMLSAGGSVSWQSKLLGNASLSSCESEYMGFSMASQEVSFLRQLQLQMQGEAGVERPVRVLVDSQPALDIVHNPVYHARTKQILAKYHFVRDRVFNEKELFFEKISASQMGADMLTKHANVGVVRYNKKLIGMA